tara:strand:- start:508 stop:804 length:297 start_codon:yes stop_codon:yes gene_type:complete
MSGAVMTEEEFRVGYTINYCIINWNPEILRWEVLYYDMVIARATEWHEKFKKTHPLCQLMINAPQIKKEDAKQQFLKMLEKVKNEEIRRKQDPNTESG